ncbi:MAG: LysR family transcriptional regulator [Alphaproteobacteria bacterium]|nr:MAG: LysR family transcriptional regulator [Alphaproteobacteria bacterium]
MHIEFRHLRTIRAIHEAGGLARAAEQLNITQSALSHQVKGLEEQVGVELFVRRSKPLKLSAAGQRLLKLAEKVLPEITQLEEDFEALKSGRSGRLHIAIECHACFEWLFPVLEEFRKAWPEVDVDIRPGLAFDALPALMREEVDLVVSSDPEDLPGVDFNPLFDYEPVFVASSQHPLAKKPFVEAEDFRDEVLITYPVERARLDLFSQLLTPAKVEPRAVRQVELTAVILLLVASNRGVAVLPDWVVREVRYHSDYVTRPITETGITRRLYAATRSEDSTKPFMAHLLRLGRTIPVRLQRGDDAAETAGAAHAAGAAAMSEAPKAAEAPAEDQPPARQGRV